MSFLNRTGKIQAGQEYENICLNKTYQYAETEDSGRNDCGRQDAEYNYDHVLRDHIAEKPDR